MTLLVAPDLELQIPQSLDDVIRLRRDEYRLRLATDAELAALSGPVADAYVRDAIEGWYIVGLQTPSSVVFFVFGYVDGRAWNTSAVKALDLERGLVQTRNSVYRLLNPGPGRPETNLLLHACGMLHKFGVGQQLGVPEVFY